MPKSKKQCKYHSFINWCLDECWRIQKHLDLTSYRIHMKKAPEITQDDYAFEVKCHFPYQSATLKWKEGTYEDWLKDKEMVTRYLLHEMLHVLVQPFARIAEARFVAESSFYDAGEELVDKLTRILAYGIIKKK